MRIGFFVSNFGGSPLTVGLDRGLRNLGNDVDHPAKPSERYDLLLVFNQCAHTTVYEYPQLPNHFGMMAFIDTAEYGYFKRMPSVAGQYLNAFSEGSMKHDTKNEVQQTRLRQMLEGRSFPYFLREFYKWIEFPIGYHPIDYPLYLHSECHEPPNRDEYLGREFELFVSWGASHPWRMKITEALRASKTKSQILVIEENGTPRMPQAEYLARTRKAKCSVSFDGYGSSSFRLHEVLVRCLLLQGPLMIHRPAPLVNGVHCVEFGIESEDWTVKGTDVNEKLHAALADPEGSFRIHEAGFYHCFQNYTETATAQYVLSTIEKHDYSKPAKLDL